MHFAIPSITNLMENDMPFSSAIVAVIIGGLIGLIGTVVANLFNSKRLKNEFEHTDKIERERHELNLKKEVFFPVIESLSLLNSYLLAIPSIEQNDKSHSDELKKLSSEFLKIDLVGSIETIETLANVHDEFSKSFFQILIKTARLNFLREKQKELQSEDRMWKDKHRKFYKSMIEHYENGTNTIEEISRLKENTKFVKRLIDDSYQELVNIDEKVFSKFKEVTTLCLDVATNLSSLTAKSISIMREELNLPFDQNRYENITKQQIEVARNSYADFMDEIELIRRNTDN